MIKLIISGDTCSPGESSPHPQGRSLSLDHHGNPLGRVHIQNRHHSRCTQPQSDTDWPGCTNGIRRDQSYVFSVYLSLTSTNTTPRHATPHLSLSPHPPSNLPCLLPMLTHYARPPHPICQLYTTRYRMVKSRRRVRFDYTRILNYEFLAAGNNRQTEGQRRQYTITSGPKKAVGYSEHTNKPRIIWCEFHPDLPPPTHTVWQEIA